ncbi:MAG: hypothetical protein M3438_04825 [Pseudomonadota bacterium]|nr:DUF4231 domain-containing protein [Sphingomonas sp.]MDQ3478465.1 hypothetical protein [Pseudomonadota bacterium]
MRSDDSKRRSGLTKRTAGGPPRVPFVFSVGVTGHRTEALSNGDAAALEQRIEQALALLRTEVLALYARERAIFAVAEPRLLFVSPLADGADQVAAEIALRTGFELQAVVPFEREIYRRRLAEASRKRFEKLLASASCVLQLPGDADRELDAFVMTGRATIAHCNMLLAVWDGLPPRGRGGTGEVVQLAITGGTPVLHVPVDREASVRLLWSAFDPAVLTLADEPTVERPANKANVQALLEGLLLPPSDPDERKFLKGFARERIRHVRTRIEYPLMLAAAGIARFGTKDIVDEHCARQIREEWKQYREGCGSACAISAPAALLEDAYSWADRLATHFAQTYRSGHIFNFLFGAIAVCLGLSAFMAPDLRLEFAAAEIVITMAIVLNAHIGSRDEWHRRWLDYRQLAERLRPMRSLKQLGIAAPDPPGTITNPVPRRWIEWYAIGVWRALACPAGSIDKAGAPRLAQAIADYEIRPQVAYHQRNSLRIDRLDRRLGTLATMLFLATLLVSLATLLGLALGAEWVDRYGAWFTLVSAGFPALGTAVFGIRFQADFGGDALRSMATANTLGQLEQELRKEVTLSRAADLTEQAARVMLGDLDEWRLVNQQRDLSVG